jgi:TolB-like protein
MGLVALAISVLLLTGFAIWRSGRHQLISSVAILPFDNLTAGADPAFSDGLTDEIAASVSRLEGLRVAGRRSAYVFKGKHDDLREVGSRLNVEAVVEGSIQQSGERTHVAVQLNRVSDGFTIWAQTFDGDSTDLIQVESEIAAAIAHALSRNVYPGLSTPAPPNPEAHALYLQGRYLWNQRNLDAELKSVDLMRRAIAKDPGYAAAWSGLADVLSTIGSNENLQPAKYMPESREAARKALELDPTSADAHAVLGFIAAHYDYDWLTAEREYRTALDLNPNYSTAHQWYALGLMARGHFAEARQQLETARRLDPLALIVSVDMALLLKFQRDFNGVIAESQSILQFDPNYHLGYSMLATGYYCSHRWDEWRAVDAKVPQLDLTRAVVNGQNEEAQRILKDYVRLAEKGEFQPHLLAQQAVRMGDKALALEWLERAYQEHDYWLLFDNVDPEMDPLREEPKFQEIIRRMGLE